jgi:dimethylaniline monooxygenase (N-oxide forming)
MGKMGVKCLRIAVIGAGPSGLVTAKELLEQGHDVLAFEQQPMIGGVFANHYDNLRLVSSNLLTSFGDHPSQEGEAHVWTCAEYLEYLYSYAARFELFPHIYCSTQVTSVRRDAGTGTWRVRVRSVQEDTATPRHQVPPAYIEAASSSPHPPAQEQEFEVDHVAVCAGAHQRGSIPTWPGLDDFGGDVLHSSHYWRPECFANRRVLIVGLGESGSDIALQIAQVAQATAVSTRRGPGYVIPRYYNGRPTDVDSSRCYHAIPLPVMESSLFKLNLRLIDAYMGPDDDPKVLHRAAEINAALGISAFRRFSTKNTAFVEALIHHSTEYKPDIERIEPGRVQFVDGTHFDCDAIVLCTGYQTQFPFFAEHHPELVDMGTRVRGLYKRMIDPAIGLELAWIGFVRPGIGSIPPCAEMQARYFALLVSGIKQLPSSTDMAHDIETHARLDREHFVADAERLATLTGYLRFLESVAEVIGCKPPLRRLFVSDLRTWSKVMFGPISSAQYRLTGSGARPEVARSALRVMPTMPAPTLAFKFLSLLASKLIYNLSANEKYRSYGF